MEKLMLLLLLSCNLVDLRSMEEKYSGKDADLRGMEEFAILLENNCEKPGSPVWKEEDQKNLTHRSQSAIENNNTEHCLWYALPPELKSHVLSCALQNSEYKCLKNFLRVNREFADLTKDFLNSSACLKNLVPELLEHNLIKSLDVFAHAIENENTVLVRALLDAGITQKLLEKGRYGTFELLTFALYLTPLNLSAVHKLFVKSAQKGNLFFIKTFIAAGVNADNAFSSSGKTAMMEAACNGHFAIVLRLIERQSSVNIAAKGDHSTALMYAVDNGHYDMADLLISHDADVNAKTLNGFRPLMIAAVRNQKEIAELLIAHKADVNAKNQAGHTALQCARQNNLGNHDDLINLLIASGAKEKEEQSNCLVS